MEAEELGVTRAMVNKYGVLYELGDKVRGQDHNGEWRGKIVQFSISIYSALVQHKEESKWIGINALTKES